MGSTISGIVGASVAGESVHALFSGKELGIADRLSPYESVVADDGSFSITGVPAGYYSLRLGHYHPDYNEIRLWVDGSKDYTVNLAPRNTAETPVTENLVTVDNPVIENPVIENPVVEIAEKLAVVESPAQAESVKTTENATTETPVIVAAVETPTIAG